MSTSILSNRREIFFAYDIRMGNPNGDPSENRPRRFRDGRVYATDVRLKRFVRDYFAQNGQDILVSKVGDKSKPLTERVRALLEEKNMSEVDGAELVNTLLEACIDARLFGSSLAFKDSKWKPVPKTLTGAVQFNHGEVLHEVDLVDIMGSSILASADDKTQGTFTSYYGLRYGLLGFHGIANEYTAQATTMTEADYESLLVALWRGVRSAANTRTKMDQVPRLLLSLEYKQGSDFQLGDLLHRIHLSPATVKPQKAWTSPKDYVVDLSQLLSLLKHYNTKLDCVRFQACPDLQMSHKPAEEGWVELDLEGLKQGG